MTCGAALQFDAQTDAAIRSAWQAIAAAGLPSRMPELNYPPHLSLLLCEDLDLAAVRRALPAWIASQPPLRVDFPALGIFPGEEGVIYLAPTVSHALLDFHAGLWALLEPLTRNPSPLYRPGIWVPHVTLDLELTRAQTGAVVEALNSAGCLPRRGVLESLFVADFTTGVGPEGSEGGAHALYTAHLGSLS